MNIKISAEEAATLLNSKPITQHIIGSRLYGTEREDSDTDILVVHNVHFPSNAYLPNYHQFQWDDEENNTQYVFTSERQFYQNLFSGDSTINVDIIMFGAEFENWEDVKRLNMLRTYNIIKAFIGFAKRDIEHYEKKKYNWENKLFHTERGLYCAMCLINNELPSLANLQEFKHYPNDIPSLKVQQDLLRKEAAELLNSGDLTYYPKLPLTEPSSTLEQKLIESNNVTQWKY